jgi:Tfp pilus assembly protein PilO
MSRVKWLLVVLVERLGWQGAGGLALLVCCAIYSATQVHPLRQEVQEMRASATGGRLAAASGDRRQELEAFKASFRQGPLEAQLKELNESGKASGLALKRIEYRMLEDRRSGLRQYQITMPVTSSYPSIRRFTSHALAKMPGLSLDHVHFQRRKIGDPAIEAELRFTLFLAEPA